MKGSAFLQPALAARGGGRACFRLRRWTQLLTRGIFKPRLSVCLCFIFVLAGCGGSAVAAEMPRQKIVAAVPSDFPPTYFKDQKTGKAAGFAVDVMDEIARRAGLEVEYVFGQPWHEIHQMLLTGKADVIPHLTISDERKRQFLFTSAVEAVPVSYLLRSGSKKIANPQPGMTVGVMNESIAHGYLKQRTDIKVVTYDLLQHLLFDLLSGQLDMVLTAAPNIRKLAIDIGVETRLQVVEPPLIDGKRGIALRPDDRELYQRLEKAVVEFVGSDPYRALYARWWGNPKPYWTGARVAMLTGGTLLATAFLLGGWFALVTSRLNRKLSRSLAETEQERARLDEAVGALRISEGRFRLLIESAPEAIFVQSEGRFVYLNPPMLQMLGAAQTEQLLGTPYIERMAPEFHDVIRERIRRQQETGKAVPPMEQEYLRLDGSRVPVETTAVGITFEGRPAHLVFVRDISARKQSEQQIRQLSLAVEQSPVCVVITDPQAAIEYVNPRFTQLTGYTFDEVRGRNPRFLKGDRTPPEEYRRLWQIITGGGQWRGEFHNRKKNGDLYWELATISPILDGRGKITHYLAVKEDITGQKLLQDQLRQAQKLESVGQLAGGVAHDFNNILAAMMMHLSFLRQNPDLDLETKESLKELMLEAQRAANLTRQLLMFSRRSVLEVKWLDMNEVVANLLKMLGRLIGEHINLTFNRRAGLPAVEADPGMIEQVLMNLCVNARDAMPQGGTLTIGLEAVKVDDSRVLLHPGASPGLFVCLSVADTGHGMDEATLQRVFEPFFTTKEAGKGTGLGLATVHGIVGQHKGWVEVESKVHHGSTFRVFLPATSRLVGPPPGAQEAEPLRGSERILLVEDEPSVRRSTALNLRLMGYSVLEATNGPRAIEAWNAHGHKIDLLLTDMVMPEGMTGLALASQLRQRRPDLKVIIVSGYSTDLVDQNVLAQEHIIRVQKPFQFSDLSKVIRQCLDTKGPQ